MVVLTGSYVFRVDDDESCKTVDKNRTQNELNSFTSMYYLHFYFGD